MSKKEMRRQLAALSFSEKVKILEKLRDRSLALAANRLRKRQGVAAARIQMSRARISGLSQGPRRLREPV
jgi:hypothetical protein